MVGLIFLAGCGGAVPGDSTASDTDVAGDPTVEAQPANGTLEVHYINVGQSVSTLIVGPDDDTMLVDTGHYNDDGEYVLALLLGFILLLTMLQKRGCQPSQSG